MVEWRAGLLILLLLPILHASIVTPIEGSEIQVAVPIAAIVIAILLGLSYMMANMLSDPKLEAWVKTEIREFGIALITITFLTVGIVVISLAGSDPSQNIGKVFTGDTAYMDTATGIIDGWIGTFDTAFKYAIEAGGKIRTASTYSPYLSIPLWYVSISYSTNPLSGSMLLLTPLTMAAQALTNAIFLSEGVRLIIVYCKVIVPKILLPGAFIVRLVPFTRKLGNTLIAVAIAAYIFLPLSVIIVDKLNATIDPDTISPDMDTDGLNAATWIMGASAPFCQAKVVRFLLGLGDYPFALIVCLFLLFIPGGQAVYPSCVFLVQNVVYPLIQVIFQILFTLFVILWEPIVMAGQKYWLDAFDIVMPFLEHVNNLVLLTYIDMILIGILTVTGARSLSAALGGEIYMFGIQRLI
ncbi:Uncharacterised protein [Candidatus Bilamarchaeum dharawalense]|uniref:Uncharacterized protein n=1 Tax=Candidatus Bilamarchaeum dharawalense TaxID=2885759 RepID=A0A5E4LUW3_9ARCH|nr:Uncharacterised protein [Candidatus Bilamarchaeum dharawalense]